jgi:diguanylate cyclase (GGDEF)-like protein/PAS domain S-box-containing protein
MEVSDAACRILDVLPNSFVGQSQSFYLACVREGERDLVAEAIREATTDGTGFEVDHRVIRKDGTERIVHLQGKILTDEMGRPQSMLGTMQDVTDKRAMETKLYFLANFHSLTHLSNQSLFLHRLAQALICGLGTSVIGVVLALGLDSYQRIRDLHGSRSGDQIIKDVAERLQHSLSACTTIAHYGGTESPLLARLSAAYQGYLYSKPVPANQLQHLLRDRVSEEVSNQTARLRNRLSG